MLADDRRSPAFLEDRTTLIELFSAGAYVTRLDGTASEAQVQWIAIGFAGEPAIHMAIRDMTERRRFETDLAPVLEKWLPLGVLVWNPDCLTALVGDYPAVQSVAHPLRSAARTVCAMAFGELCGALEVAGRSEDTAECLDLAFGLAPGGRVAGYHPENK